MDEDVIVLVEDTEVVGVRAMPSFAGVVKLPVGGDLESEEAVGRYMGIEISPFRSAQDGRAEPSISVRFDTPLPEPASCLGVDIDPVRPFGAELLSAARVASRAVLRQESVPALCNRSKDPGRHDPSYRPNSGLDSRSYVERPSSANRMRPCCFEPFIDLDPIDRSKPSRESGPSPVRHVDILLLTTGSMARASSRFVAATTANPKLCLWIA